MADERIPITYIYNPKTGDIHRKKGKGDEIVEDKVVATYDEKTYAVTFPKLSFVRAYKQGVITFLAENEMIIRSFQRADIKADPPLTKNTPSRPKKLRHEGDKTKEVVDWYFKHRYNEFCTRYGYLGPYTGPVLYLKPNWVARPVDGLLEYRGVIQVETDVVDAMVTTRKTHLSYTPDECLNWDEEDPEANEEYERGAPAAVRGGEETED